MLRLHAFCAAFLLICTLPAGAQQAQTPPQTGAPQLAKPAQTAQKPQLAPKTPAGKTPLASAAATPAEKAKLLEKIKDWTVFIYEDAQGRVCFAATTPTDMLPKTAKRTAAIFYITTWKKDGVKNEVSIKQGYALKPALAPSASINNQTFSLVAEGDKAFAKNTAEEQKLLQAMQAGGVITVKATSAKGTATTDQYSLNGVPEALKKLQEACP